MEGCGGWVGDPAFQNYGSWLTPTKGSHRAAYEYHRRPTTLAIASQDFKDHCELDSSTMGVCEMEMRTGEPGGGVGGLGVV